MDLEIRREHVRLLPSRAVHWPARQALLIADLHLGKADAFADAGVPVPDAPMRADLDRLSAAVESCSAERLFILGDLFHSRHAHRDRPRAAFARWRARHPRLETTLIRGNHDRSAGDPLDADLTIVDGPHRVGPFLLAHEPIEHDDGFVWAGHIHPGVTLASGGAGGRLRAPCFVIGPRRAILPAFAAFTGLGRFAAEGDDRIIAVGGGSAADEPSLADVSSLVPRVTSGRRSPIA